MIAPQAMDSQQLEDNLAAYLQASSALWNKVDEPDIIEWITNNLRFGPGDRGVQLESRIGPFTFADSPWWEFPLRVLVDEECRSLAMPAATQVHKTVNLLFGVPLFFAEFRPAPGMIIVPDEGEAKKVRDRIYAIVQESQRFTTFNRIKVPPLHKWNLQEIDLGSMLIHLAWAGSRSRTRSKPCHYVFFTEVDVYRSADVKAGDPVAAGKQRSKDVFRYKHIFESSPSEKPSTVSEEESQADNRWRWYLECPTCGKRQEARFFPHRTGKYAGKGGICFTVDAPKSKFHDPTVVERSGLMTPQQARSNAHYVCLNGCTIENPQKAIATEGGDWYPLGWNVEAQGEPNRNAVQHVGFHLWAIHSVTETFGSIAEDYLRSLINGTKVDFYGNRLAIAYEGESRVPVWSELGRRAAWTHGRRMVPHECWFITAGIDCQSEDNGVRYVVRGWAPGRTSWLIDWGWVERRDDLEDNGLVRSDLIQLEQRLLRHEFIVCDDDNQPTKNPLGKERLPVRLTNIDATHLPKKVHEWLRQLPEKWIDSYANPLATPEHRRLIPGRVRAVHGQPRKRPEVRFRHSLVERNARSGEPYEGGLHWWELNVYPYYSEMTNFITGQPGGLGSWYVTADCLAQGREYLQQICNFHYVVTTDKKHRKKGEWKPRSGSIPVDFWDCEIYALAAAEMVVGNMGWDQHVWIEEWTAKKKRKQRRRQPVNPVDVEEIGARA